MTNSLELVRLAGEIRRSGGRDKLHFTLFNNSPETFVFLDDCLDGRNQKNFFAIITDSPFRQSLERVIPLTVYDITYVTILPGEQYEYEFVLENYFIDLPQFLQEGNLTLFWSVRLEPLDFPPAIVGNGFAILPQSREE